MRLVLQFVRELLPTRLVAVAFTAESQPVTRPMKIGPSLAKGMCDQEWRLHGLPADSGSAKSRPGHSRKRSPIMKTLRQLFLSELADMYDAEHRITKALPKLAKAATCTELRAALLTHLKETEEQVKRLEEVFKLVGTKPKAKKCEATVGLLKEGASIASENKGSPAINAALISAAQKVEHYEIASYGCLYQWAMVLGHEQAAELLEETLDEEKQADRILTELAEAKNLEALDAEGEFAAPANGRKGLQSRKRGARRDEDQVLVAEE